MYIKMSDPKAILRHILIHPLENEQENYHKRPFKSSVAFMNEKDIKSF